MSCCEILYADREVSVKRGQEQWRHQQLEEDVIEDVLLKM